MENNQPKKKNAGLTALIALLLIITTIASCLGIYAWAKYTQRIDGQASAAVAKWSFNVNLKKGQQTVALSSEAIDLATTTAHVADNRIAPGTSGTFDIEIDTQGTEVSLQYEVSLGLENCPRNITFSRKTGESGGQDVFTPISAGGSTNTRSRTITFSKDLSLSDVTTANTNQTTFIERIHWDWPYELTEGSDADKLAYDTRDKDDEIAIRDAGLTTTMNITVTGTETMEEPVDPNSVQGLAQSGAIQQWDPIQYDPGTGSISTASLPEGTSIKSSRLASTLNVPGARLDGELSVSGITDWKVLDVNTSTGEVLIVPANVPQVRLQLEGKDGYNNAITALNQVAAIYANPSYANSARSLTVEDVNKLERDAGNNNVPTGGNVTELYKWKHRYGVDSNLNITDSGIESENQEDQPLREYQSTAETGYYNYGTTQFGSDGEYGISCWLASRCLYVDSSSCHFSVYVLSDGVYYNHLFSVGPDGSSGTGYSNLPVVPVVSLKSDIQLEEVENYQESEYASPMTSVQYNSSNNTAWRIKTN